MIVDVVSLKLVAVVCVSLAFGVTLALVLLGGLAKLVHRQILCGVVLFALGFTALVQTSVGHMPSGPPVKKEYQHPTLFEAEVAEYEFKKARWMAMHESVPQQARDLWPLYATMLIGGMVMVIYRWMAWSNNYCDWDKK